MSVDTRAEVKFPVSSFRRRYKKGGYHCDLCDIFVGWSVENAITHERGKRHLKRLVTGQEYSIDDLEASVNSYCDVCQSRVLWTAPCEEWAVGCHAKAMRKHVHGRKHVKQFNWRVDACRKDLEASAVCRKLPALLECGYWWGKFPRRLQLRLSRSTTRKRNTTLHM